MTCGQLILVLICFFIGFSSPLSCEPDAILPDEFFESPSRHDSLQRAQKVFDPISDKIRETWRLMLAHADADADVQRQASEQAQAELVTSDNTSTLWF